MRLRPIVPYRFTFTHEPICCQHRYGAHLSKEEVADLVAPHPDTLELVGSWLAHHEVPSSSVSITHGGSWLSLSRVPLAQANALLGASYKLYRNTETDEIVLRTIGYALPAVLHHHVQTVAPTTYFGSPRALRQTSRLVMNGPTLPKGDIELQNSLTALSSGTSVPSNCSDTITPTCLRLLYNTIDYEPRAQGENELGIAGYLGQFPSQLDLTQFMGLFRPDAARAAFSAVTIKGGTDDQNHPGVEVRTVLPPMVHVSVTCEHRLTLTSNMPSRYPTRRRTPTTAQAALRLSFLTA